MDPAEITPIDPNLTSSQSPASVESGSKKRGPASTGFDKDGNPKPVKRRAAKACAACRARKVRCDVMQRYHVTPDGEVTCSNCTMDGIRCVIEESKRRKKTFSGSESTPAPQIANGGRKQAFPNGVHPPELQDSRRWSESQMSDQGEASGHVPHAIYQTMNQQINISQQGDMMRRASYIPIPGPYESEASMTYNSLMKSVSITGDRTVTRLESPAPAPPLKHQLPAYLKPLPQRMTSVDIDYLFAKGALSLPDVSFRNALLRSYIEYVHPYMPLIEVHDVLNIIDKGSGENGQISLLLFQAIMFAGTAFVDISLLRQAGFTTRKAARKAFFQKARVLYDFDYELDRVALVQSLLLMTYWYETPDDQKDTWHWMGVAISLAHTIGLHRNPENSNMEPKMKKLWKRIWWSCFMRDRLVALGMRRPTRVKDEDYDVPMLTLEDFDTTPLPESNSIIPLEYHLVRDQEAQERLAQMCIAKAKLCLCVSHVLSAQYSVLIKNQGMQGLEGNTRSSVMLFPKKLDQTDEVKRCDEELSEWINALPETCAYSDEMQEEGSSGPPMFVQRSLLHMIYFTTLSALHRPQVLPSGLQPDSSRELQDLSRKKVRECSREITRISQALHIRKLERFLPTTGVTVLLPAIIIHLLDIKSSNEKDRQQAMDGFCQCMVVLEKLRDTYASADFATQFLDAAIKRADIDVVMSNTIVEKTKSHQRRPPDRRTPPPDLDTSATVDFAGVDEYQVVTPPDTDSSLSSSGHDTEQTFDISAEQPLPTQEFDVNDFLNFDNTGNEMWNVPLEEGAHGESGGFLGDMEWIGDQGAQWSRFGTPQADGHGGGEMFPVRVEVSA